MKISPEDFIKEMQNTIFRNKDTIKFYSDGDVLLTEYEITKKGE